MATQKQKKAIAKLIENHGNVSKAMREAGYTEASARNPRNLTDSLAYKAIADLIPDELLSEKHLALLNKQDADGNIDVQAVKAGLDMGYKLKGSYAPEKRSVHVDLTEIKNKDDAELAKLAGFEE